MVLFFPVQQELDCISSGGDILGKISFDGLKDEYVFNKDNESVMLSSEEQALIAKKLVALKSGQSSVPMQDDD